VSLGDVAVLWRREVAKFVRPPARTLILLLTPLMWLLVFGIGLQRGLGAKVNGLDYVHFILPGLIGMNLLTSSARGGNSILRDKEWGFLKEVLVAPVPRSHILLGIGLGVVSRSAVQAALLMLAGAAIGVNYGATVAAAAQAIALTFGFLFLLGLGLVGLTIGLAWRLDDLQSYSAASNAVVFPLTLLSGALFPVQNLPWWLDAPIHANPITYGVDALRQAMLGADAVRPHFDLLLDVGVLLAFLAATLTFAGLSMRRHAA
jgi:ABC-2 type transport system permease protein